MTIIKALEIVNGYRKASMEDLFLAEDKVLSAQNGHYQHGWLNYLDNSLNGANRVY